MPELPEVEIVKRELEQKILEGKILDVYQSDKSLRLPMPKLSCLLGMKILSITRRNKYIILEFNDYWCLIHLGMTGRLTVESDSSLKKHTHYRMELDNGVFLKYEDARRFGLILLYNKVDFPTYHETPQIKQLGVEPLSKDFTFNYLKEGLKNNKTVIKKIIMDNNFLCGVGNIYASEILFLCGINPQEAGKNLTDEDINNLQRYTVETLEKSISLGGSSISDYVHTNGVKGEMQNFYNTYGMYGQDCKACGTSIERVNIGGRNSYYCPHCQPLKS